MATESNDLGSNGVNGQSSASNALSGSKGPERVVVSRPISGRVHFALLTLVVLLAIGAWTLGRNRLEHRAVESALTRAAVVAREEHRVRDLDIEFYRMRAANDPISADDRSHLAQLYLARGRASGDPEDARRSEAEARGALAIRSGHNSSALLLLTSALLEQHRFAEALEAAATLVAREPDDESHRALLAEVYLELGRYDEARATFATITASRRALTVAPRLARLAEIEGRNDAARAMLKAARDEAVQRPGIPREQIAWFHLRLADSEMRAGRFRSARESLDAALAVHPDDHRVLAALATLATLREDWKASAEFGERAMAIVPDPTTLGLVADAHNALGDSSQAKEFQAAVEMTALGTPGPLHRAWSLFLLDHGRRITEVHERIEQELRTRRDVYGYDALAWSYHVQGRNAEAQRAMRSALAQGTRDALMFYHAGMIELALGNTIAGRVQLEQALVLNPHFHPMHAARARDALKNTRSGCGGRNAAGCRSS